MNNIVKYSSGNQLRIPSIKIEYLGYMKLQFEHSSDLVLLTLAPCFLVHCGKSTLLLHGKVHHTPPWSSHLREKKKKKKNWEWKCGHSLWKRQAEKETEAAKKKLIFNKCNAKRKENLKLHVRWCLLVDHVIIKLQGQEGINFADISLQKGLNELLLFSFRKKTDCQHYSYLASSGLLIYKSEKASTNQNFHSPL